MYTPTSFPRFFFFFFFFVFFFSYNFYIFIKIINTFNHMVYISEYQPMCLGKSNHLTPFSAILGHQRPRYKNLRKYTSLFFPQFFFKYL